MAQAAKPQSQAQTPPAPKPAPVAPSAQTGAKVFTDFASI